MEFYGFNENDNKIQKYILDSDIVNNYHQKRNFPELNATSKIGPYLRFGTISIRKIIKGLLQFEEQTFMDELIWREFFMQILFHFPHTQTKSFKSKYDNIVWLNDIKAFEAWKTGKTGFPIVDAGMRELNNTGFMHNRVRMITASFLCKHLLIDWRWGENYFAQKLNDYEMASNVGNWQWASGSGVDAAPYFRIFNPHTQITKFDKKLNYINKWLKIDSDDYPEEIIEHKFARVRCLETYKKYLD
jgi:deoxyribodipyrimidine photo-lyase